MVDLLLIRKIEMHANRILATPGGGGRAHPALKLFLRLNTQYSSFKSGKIYEESVLRGQLLSKFQFSSHFAWISSTTKIYLARTLHTKMEDFQ